MNKYIIIRFYKDPLKESEIIKRDLTLNEAKYHCNNPKSMIKGVYFDGYTKQNNIWISIKDCMDNNKP